jgi:hypothetical protein
VNMVSLGNPCSWPRGNYLLFADRPVLKVMMISGDRQFIVPVNDMYFDLVRTPKTKIAMSFFDAQSLLDRTYVLPLDDKSWPDDTLIVFENMEDQADDIVNQQAGKGTL